MEIGHGGGRILAAASRYFHSVIGVDIHENNEKVENELLARGVNNCRLIKTEGRKIPVETKSIDFVYSFIVLMHVANMETLQSLLFETHRVLKPNQPLILNEKY